MGWIILVVYLSVGVWSTRLILRWCALRWDSLPMTWSDFVLSAVMGLMWPIGLPVAYALLAPPRRNDTSKTDAMFRKFAGLPPRKD